MSPPGLPGVGVDIEAVSRFTDPPRSLFTDGEWAHAGGRADSLAGIWCAKEAVVKAVSRWRAIHVRDVEVMWEADRPCVLLSGFRIEVSISHTWDQAMAVALAAPVSVDG